MQIRHRDTESSVMQDKTSRQPEHEGARHRMEDYLCTACHMTHDMSCCQLHAGMAPVDFRAFVQEEQVTALHCQGLLALNTIRFAATWMSATQIFSLQPHLSST